MTRLPFVIAAMVAACAVAVGVTLWRWWTDPIMVGPLR